MKVSAPGWDKLAPLPVSVSGAPIRLQLPEQVATAPRVPAVHGLHSANAASVGIVVAAACYSRSRAARRGALNSRSVAVEARAAALVQEVSPDTEHVSAEKVDFVKGLFKNVLDVRPPTKLEVFLEVIQGSGYDVLGKDEWRSIGGDLHPLFLPLAKRGSSDETEVMGMLVRKPAGAALRPDEYLVVSQRPRQSRNIILIAMNIDNYIAKRAEEANFRKGFQDLPVIEATKDVYDVRFGGGDRTALDKWLLLEVGAFPSVYKNLAVEQLDGPDKMSGLVIAETMRDTFGTSWGFPHAFLCRTLRDHFNGKGFFEKRELEADHCAQRCFTTGYPLWTLEDDGDTLESLLLEAKMPKLGDMDSLRVFFLKRSTDDQRVALRTKQISLGCIAMAKSQALMDAVCCGHKSYNGIRQEVRDLYDEVPGREGLVDMIDYFKQ